MWHYTNNAILQLVDALAIHSACTAVVDFARTDEWDSGVITMAYIQFFSLFGTKAKRFFSAEKHKACNGEREDLC